MSSEYSAISAVIENYFDGLYEGDIPKLEDVFHTSCMWYNLEEDSVAATPVSEKLKQISERPSAKSQNLERSDHIASIELAAPDLAYARLNLQLPPRYFTDYMTLLKEPGTGWKIVSKTYRFDTRD